MKADFDPILEAALEEVLGGVIPPDLSARILKAWDAKLNQQQLAAPPHAAPIGSNGNGHAYPHAPPVALPSVAAEPIPPPIASASPTPLVRVSGNRRRSSAATWSAAGIAALVLVAASATFYINREPNLGDEQTLAHVANPPPTIPSVKTVSPDIRESQPEGSAIASANPAVSPPRNAAAPGRNTPATQIDPPAPETQKSSPSEVVAKPAPSVEPVRAKPVTSEVVSYVNFDLSTAWKASGVKPAEAATESEWCRRVYLRLLGRIPTVEELQHFTSDKRSSRRQLLIDRLIDSELYSEEFVQHWATIWTNLLIGRTGGRDNNDLASRDGLQRYLKESFRQNKPYDKLVHELISATGASRPEAEGFNGATNFLLASLDDDATLATMRVSRLFLGINLHCAQCHNHPSLDWKQKDYWSLNACFRQMGTEGQGESIRLINRDFAGKSGDVEEAEVYFQLPSGVMAAAYPRFLDGAELSRSGKIEVNDRRTRIAELISQSQWVAPTAVNRMWAHFFGYGFMGPQEDLWGDGQPTHPELVEKLSGDFVASGYDLRSLMRWIVQTDAFNRSSKLSAGTLADSPEAGTVPLFSRYYTRQLQAEEVYDSLLVAGNSRRKAGQTGDVTQARVQWLSQFNRRMATDDGREESNFDGSFRQALTLMNGELMQHVVNEKQDGRLRGVIESNLPFDQKVEHLFLAALSRRPTKKELAAVRQLSKDAAGDIATTLQDVWWALLNSNEFILDH